jgi:hypothetical protein
MKSPQSLAEELYAIPLAEIADFGCCAFVLIWCLGLEISDIDAIKKVADGMKRGVLDLDCTVKWYEFASFLGRPIKSVEFKQIDDIKGIKERTPVRYDYNGKSHWVGVEKGKIAFNSLKNSVCVKYGKPTTARILTREKK